MPTFLSLHSEQVECLRVGRLYFLSVVLCLVLLCNGGILPFRLQCHCAVLTHRLLLMAGVKHYVSLCLLQKAIEGTVL